MNNQFEDEELREIITAFAVSGAAAVVARDLFDGNGTDSARAMAKAIGEAGAMIADAALEEIKKRRTPSA